MEFLQDGKPLTPQRAWFGTHRERMKGEKKLSQIPIASDALRVGEVQALRRYDRVFGIDTNTKEINGNRISVTCISEGRFTSDVNDELFEYAVLGAIEIHNGPKNAENFAWHLVFNAILNSPDHFDSSKYGIVTDSDLGAHGAYNARNAPYFGNHHLPENFTLIYAFEKGAGLTNSILRLCDNEARKMLKQVERGELAAGDATSVHTHICDKFRGWSNNNVEFLKAGWLKLGSIPPTTFDG